METKLMTLIDKNKTNISDGDYVEICNMLKKMHNKNKNYYLVKYYKLSFENDLKNNSIKQNFKIKIKKVIIEDEEILEKLKDLCCGIKRIPNYKFKFVTDENNETHLDTNCHCHKNKSHTIYNENDDDEDDEELSIEYDDIFVINYEKIEE